MRAKTGLAVLATSIVLVGASVCWGASAGSVWVARLGDPAQVEQARDRLRELGAQAVPALLEGLTKKEDTVRAESAFVLGRVGSRQVVPALIKALKDPAKQVREKAAYALGELADPRATQGLIKCLQDPQTAVRANAAFALGQIGSPDATTALIVALRDSDTLVRNYAASALGFTGDKRALGPLVWVIENDTSEEVRALATSSLANLRDARVSGELIKLLEDPVLLVRARAIDGLYQVTGQRFGYDPRAGAGKRAGPVAQWKAWYGKNRDKLGTLKPVDPLDFKPKPEAPKPEPAKPEAPQPETVKPIPVEPAPVPLAPKPVDPAAPAPMVPAPQLPPPDAPVKPEPDKPKPEPVMPSPASPEPVVPPPPQPEAVENTVPQQPAPEPPPPPKPPQLEPKPRPEPIRPDPPVPVPPQPEPPKPIPPTPEPPHQVQPADEPEVVRVTVGRNDRPVNRERVPLEAYKSYDQALALYDAVKYEEALAAFQTCVEKAPDWPDALYNLALTHRRLGQLEQARQTYEKLLVIEPKNQAALNNLGIVYELLEMPDKAADCYRRALAVKVEQPHVAAAHNLADLLFRQEKYAEALTLYDLLWKNRQSLPAELPAAGIHVKRMTCYLKLRRTDDLHKLFALEGPPPDDAALLREYARYRYAETDYAGCERALLRALRAGGQDASSADDLSRFYLTVDDPKLKNERRALTYAEQAAAQSPHDPRYWRSVVKASLACGKKDRAVEALKKVVALDPNDAEAAAQLKELNRLPGTFF